MKEVKTNCRVTMDTQKDDSIIVHISAKEVLVFKLLANGLYGFDTVVDKVSSITTHSSFFSTVAKNKEHFSTREIEGAHRAQILQSRVGWPSDKDFKEALNRKGQSIINADITANDVSRADAIQGGIAEQLLLGKMVRY